MAGKPFRRGTRWAVVVELGKDPVSGKRRQQWLYGATRKDVAEAQVKLLRERDTGTSLDPTKLTVGEFLADWLDTIVKPHRAILTYEKREREIRNHLTPALGSIPLAKLTARHIARCYAALGEQGYSGTTLHTIHGGLRAALQVAVQWKMIPHNPAALCEPPQPDTLPPTLWDDATLNRFLDLIAGRRFEPHYLLTLNTGLRFGEVFGLRWADIDLHRGHLTLARQQIRSTQFGHMEAQTKGKRARGLALTPDVVAVLRAHRKEQTAARLACGAVWHDEDRVFPNGIGGPLAASTLRGDWQRTLKRGQLPPMRFHGLRHLHATYLMIAGVHTSVIADRLGHATPAITTKTYLHVTSALDEQAADAFAARLGAVRARAAEGAN